MTGLNGSGRRHEDGKIASLEEARRRAEARAKEEKRGARDARLGRAVTARDWVVGGLLVLMALGMVWHWLAPLAGFKGLVR